MNSTDTPGTRASARTPSAAPTLETLAGLRIEPAAQADLEVIRGQLGRTPRGVAGIASRCPSGHPNVVATLPRLPGGTPFPTTFYVTCPALTSAIGTLEAGGLMAAMTERLGEDDALAAAYRGAHEDYLGRRRRLGTVPEIEGITAGGMPSRVKCLHVLVGHSLAAGRGVNPLGDEALDALAGTWPAGGCAAS